MYRIIGADGRNYGPVSADELRQWIAEGRANGFSQVEAEGSIGWRALGSYPEFAEALAAVMPPPPALLPVIEFDGRRVAKTNGFAIAGFVLALISVPSFCCCCLSPPCSILGLIFSCMGLSQISRNPFQGGRKLAIAGIIIAVIGLLISTGCLLFGFAGAMNDPSFFQ